jgi:hypothetical protein
MTQHSYPWAPLAPTALRLRRGIQLFRVLTYQALLD